jgi:hypothetical protein
VASPHALALPSAAGIVTAAGETMSVVLVSAEPA